MLLLRVLLLLSCNKLLLLLHYLKNIQKVKSNDEKKDWNKLLTKRRRVKSGNVVKNTFPSRNDSFTLPISNEHQINFFPTDFEVVLFVPSKEKTEDSETYKRNY